MRVSRTEVTAHRVFRCLLQAMSRPGRLYTLPPPTGAGPWEAVLTLLESLLDHEVSFAVIGGDGARELPSLVASRTRCRAADIGEADWVIVPHGDAEGRILQAKRGTPQYPDRSATIVFRVPTLLGGESRRPAIALTGPGIRGEIRLGPIEGLGPREAGHLREINREFPLGVDAVFIDDAGRILCIPRSTQIRIVED